MTPDIHRAPSRLASFRPESRWKTHSTLPSDQPVSPGRGVPLREPADYDLEQDIADGVPGVALVHDSFAEEYAPGRSTGGPEIAPARDDAAPDSQSIYEIDDEQPYHPMPAVRANGNNGQARSRRLTMPKPQPQPDYAPPAAQPSPPRGALEPEPETYDFTQQRGELSPADQYQLLLYNIQLYDDSWKLLHIRGAKEDKWMRAYLIPRHSKMGWDEARQSGQLLQIGIDNYGNTVVREPKKPGLLRRLLNWLYGR